MEGTEEVMTHLTTGAVVVYGIQWLKQISWFKWLSDDTGMVNRVASAIAAAGIAFGISATGDASTGWVITIPSLTVLAGGGWEFVKQFMVQQVLYDGVAQKAGRARLVNSDQG